MQPIDQVRVFHEAFDIPNPTLPMDFTAETALIRLHLIQEELSELALGLAAHDPVEILDALADLEVVLQGTWLSLGFSGLKDAAMAEVHRSNMSKLVDGRPKKTPAGRVMKGPDYSQADFGKIFKDFMTSRENK